MPSSPTRQLDPRELKHLAELARLDRLPELDGAEGESFVGNLRAILEYVGLLEALPSGQAPASAVVSGPAPVLRRDEPRPSLDRERALAAAPQREGALISVKRVIR